MTAIDLTFDETEARTVATEAAENADQFMRENAAELELTDADLVKAGVAAIDAADAMQASGAPAIDLAPTAPETSASTTTIEAEPFRPLKASTIRPGMMVVLRTSVRGNVSYTKQVIESEYETDDGKAKEKWETERTVTDPAEHKESVTIRSRLRQMITNVCSSTSFGLLCPMNKEDELNRSIKDARDLMNEFNSRAKTTKINMFVIAGKVADSDVEAARAINAEVSELMETMEAGLKNLDVKAVRDAADKAKQLGSMLSDNASEKLKEAIAVARNAATAMKKAAETGAAEIDLVAIRKITESRTAFLDHDMAGELEAPVHEGRALDLAPIEDEAPTAPAAEAERPAVQLDIE